jgi:hypothetical protein
LRTDAGNIGKLVFPDISGEVFEEQWAHRVWSRQFADLVAHGRGLLLFLHPKHISKPFSINDERRLLAVLEEEQEGERDAAEKPWQADGSVESPKVQDVLWEPVHASSQAKLVDILQMIRTRWSPIAMTRVGIIVSAWDLVVSEDSGAEPSKWVAASMPLLDQFLAMNPEQFIVRVYGVSAQGGDNAADGDNLRKVNEPSHRIVVVGPDCAEHDITSPVKWVMGLDAP